MASNRKDGFTARKTSIFGEARFWVFSCLRLVANPSDLQISASGKTPPCFCGTSLRRSSLVQSSMIRRVRPLAHAKLRDNSSGTSLWPMRNSVFSCFSVSFFSFSCLLSFFSLFSLLSFMLFHALSFVAFAFLLRFSFFFFVHSLFYFFCFPCLCVPPTARATTLDYTKVREHALYAP